MLPLPKDPPGSGVHVPQPTRKVAFADFSAPLLEGSLHAHTATALQPRLRNHEAPVVRTQAELANLDELETHLDAAFHVFDSFGPPGSIRELRRIVLLDHSPLYSLVHACPRPRSSIWHHRADSNARWRETRFCPES